MTIPEHRLSAARAHRVAVDSLLWRPGMDVGVGPEWSAVPIGAGTIAKVVDQHAIRLTAPTTNAEGAAVWSRESFADAPFGARYSFGLYHADGGQSAQERVWGRWDGDSGITFRLVGTSLFLRIKRAGGADESIPQANWLALKTGLDVTKLHRFEIEAGPTGARCFVDDTLVYTFEKAGVLAETIAKTMALPWGAAILNSGPSVSSSMTIFDAAVWSGGPPPSGPSFASAAQIALAGAGVHMLSVRVKTTALRTVVHPTRLAVRAGAQACAFRVLLGATLTAPSWNPVDGASHVETDVVATVAGGTLLAELNLGPNQGGEIDLRDVFGWGKRSLVVPPSFMPTADILTVVGVSESGTPTGRAALHWNEVR